MCSSSNVTGQVHAEDLVFAVGDQEVRSVPEDEHRPEPLAIINGPNSSRSAGDESVTSARTVPPTRYVVRAPKGACSSTRAPPTSTSVVERHQRSPRSLVATDATSPAPSNTTTSLVVVEALERGSGRHPATRSTSSSTPAPRRADRLGDHLAGHAGRIRLAGAVDVGHDDVRARSKAGAKSSTSEIVRVTRWGWKTAVMRS